LPTDDDPPSATFTVDRKKQWDIQVNVAKFQPKMVDRRRCECKINAAAKGLTEEIKWYRSIH
jgi:hypothetical protein